MTGLDSVAGQGPAVRSLERLLATGRIPHALLFRGPEGVGKATAARAFAAALLCGVSPGSACGDCAACRAIDTDTHPDVITITRLPKAGKAGATASAAQPEDDEGGEGDREAGGDLSAFIVVAQIRELARLAPLAPRAGKLRLFLVDPADRMNLEAQNALLKTLEEPPPHTLLILIASRPHMLLPTVRSRSFSVGFSALGAREIVDLLERHGLPTDEAHLRAALSARRPGKALTLDLPALAARRERALEMLEALTAGPAGWSELSGMASTLAGADADELAENLELAASLLRDTARAGLDSRGEALLHRDLAPRLAALARRLHPPRAAALVTTIDRARGWLRVNANRTLTAESVLAEVARAML